LDKLFNLYLEELIEWNKKFNLTAITNPDDIKIKHFEDSLSLLKVIDLKDQSVIDIGSGAGFPGIPLKIARPEIKLTLLDATRKKTEFLKHIVKVLNLKDVEIIWGRAEEKAKPIYDIVVARAVAKMPTLVKYCLPFVKPGGLFIAYKQDQVEAEVGSIQATIKKVKVGNLTRSLVIVEKKNPL